MPNSSVEQSDPATHTHTRAHTHTYIYIHSFFSYIPPSLSQETGYSSLCCTAGPHCPSILNFFKHCKYIKCEILHIFPVRNHIISIVLIPLSLSVLNRIDQSFPLGLRPGVTDFSSNSSHCLYIHFCFHMVVLNFKAPSNVNFFLFVKLSISISLV